ncbi:MAG TPA: Glu-tRNA(Gln) amidotransferase subunit GatE [Ignisphaera aggregans]|uniref:Glutamyl-tRNA(Gln) amidotransferase subunit E n=1 Tax=Ignisphaera aggregans TaxID=334771 RepID=A0A832YZE9_9CREN|nr:Glu-tRNA(Gln) amidotransferase subunit GatE [Ignisphaera aggregans]
MRSALRIPENLDYKALELRVGFEIHRQLDTKHKLFCNCPTKLVSERELAAAPRFRRYLRATRSELGEVDVAAAFEEQRKRVFEYIAPPSASCLVELDEEPPHELNREALAVAIAIAKAFHARLVDEIHVMRKIVIDGSNTTGFQRTAIVAVDGYIDDEEGPVRIQTIALEEDAARKIEERDGLVVYSLDRLGIPLIEISTAPDIRSPQQAKRVAEKIGLVLRLTGKVKRGIGTVRQDINLSIRGSPKVEIKGVQRLELIPKVIENEVRRLYGLLMIRDELQRRGVKADDVLKQEPIDVTEILKECPSKLLKNAVKRGARIYAIKLPKFSGLLGVELQPGRRFGTELADYAKQWAGVQGIIHSDELPNYGIDEPYISKLREVLCASDEDAFVLIADEPSKAKYALEIVRWRAAMAINGIPKETRAANDDGTTRYLRPQPGAARMYPETDVPPVRIDEKLLEEALRYVPPDPSEKIRELISKYGLSYDLAKQIITSDYMQLFETMVSKYGIDPTLAASIFTTLAGELRKEGLDIDSIDDESFMILAEALSRYGLPKDAVLICLKELARGRRFKDAETMIKELGLTKASESEIRHVVREVIETYRSEISQRGERAFSFIMGKVMARLRGRADGRVVASIVKEMLNTILRSTS